MKERQYDKSYWAHGPWDDEPDRLQFKTEAGFPGLIVRNRVGALCGYVGVPRGHRFYLKSYDEVTVDVHGGLTYSDRCMDDGPICHVPEPGDTDDVWWFGFDCAHAGDLIPGTFSNALDDLIVSLASSLERLSDFSIDRDTYRDIGYVRKEVEQLAEQLL